MILLLSNRKAGNKAAELWEQMQLDAREHGPEAVVLGDIEPLA